MKNKYKELLQEKNAYKSSYEYYEKLSKEYFDKYFEVQEKLGFVYLFLLFVILFFFALCLLTYKFSMEEGYKQGYCKAHLGQILNDKCIDKNYILEIKK